MGKMVYVSEQGNDKASGESETTPVRTAAQAIKIADRTKTTEICVLGDDAMRNRLTAELAAELKKENRLMRKRGARQSQTPP